jgi:hypothetical protein
MIFIAAIVIFGACWLTSAFIKDRFYSSGLFAVGVAFFLFFMLVGCHHAIQDLSHVP